MFDKTTTYIVSIKRHYAHIVAFVVGVLVGASLLWHMVPAAVEAPALDISTHTGIDQKSLSTYERSAPTRLQIPSIKLDAEFETPLRLHADKTIEVPDSYEKVGWFEYGATPGEVGPATILGHVDSYKGPAVFYNLGKLEKGDEIAVTRADGTIATFIVETLERYDQDVFPTEKVYGPIDYAGLRLITCSGTFNKAEQKYSHNLVVYGRLLE